LSGLDRETWRRERRLWNEVQMDATYARQYDDHWGGSHFYPTNEQTRTWLTAAGFRLTETRDGDGYRHYLVHA
jgi:hypothetical protein